MPTRSSPKLKDVVLNETAVAGGPTVTEEVAVCVRVPEVPVTVTLVVAGTAVEDAEMLNVLIVSAARDRLDGVAVTPAGRVPSVTATVPLKPFSAAVATLSVCAEPPGTTLMVAGAASSEKSAVPPLLLFPPPQPRIAAQGRRRVVKRRRYGFIGLQVARKLAETNGAPMAGEPFFGG